MEYIVFGALALAFIVALIIKDIFNDRRKKREFERSLRANYGKPRNKEVKLERFVRIDKYFQKHQEDGQIDNVTWNDLDMDDIFRDMNDTYSASGEEYLYYTLRSPGKTEKELENFENLVEYFRTHEDERVYAQILMAKLGYMGKFSLYDYIDNLDYLGERSNAKAWAGNVILIACIAAIPFFTSYAIIGAVAVMIYNIVTYFKEKSDIEPYVISFVYVIKLIDAARRMEKLPGGRENPLLKDEMKRLKELCDKIQSLQRGSFLVTTGNRSMSGNPLDIIMDYLKMTFHVDLIKFNNMLAFLRKNVEKVDEINTILGRYETAIAVGAFRTRLANANGYCIPKLWEGDAKGFVMEAGYHPLLSEPVKNSLQADRGILLTGSNASGKSTFLKTLAINAIFAQTIHTCMADRYASPFFRIYSSMSLRDDIEGGDSYYIVEIKALKRILTAAKEGGRPVLCFVDEVLRGTNTVERIAASTQVLKSLCGDRVLCCAATHDVELTHLLENAFDNYHFEEEIEDGDILFQYRLLAGRATTRNAIKLLEIIGYDEEIVKKAQDMAQAFVETGTWS